ncbi:MAG: hypothetical protein ACOCZK_03410 [Planctomycetota bacterium]
MSIHRILLLAACTIVMVAAENGSSSYRPRVSTRAIPLNGTVRIACSTMQPIDRDVDIATTVRNALGMPGVLQHWRLKEDAEVIVHPKAGDVAVSALLMPRHAGTLPLPKIPATWMGRDEVVHFGSVTVDDKLQLGADTIPLPDHLDGVAGYAWGTSRETLLADIPEHRYAEATDTRPAHIQVDRELKLVLREDLLTEAWLTARRVDLDTGLEYLMRKWGDPIVNRAQAEEEPSVIWQLGWLRIVASPHPIGGTRIHMVHEGVGRELAGDKVAEDIFSLLDGRGGRPSRRAEADQAPAESTAPAATDTTDTEDDDAAGDEEATAAEPELDEDDFTREFDRALRQVD